MRFVPTLILAAACGLAPPAWAQPAALSGDALAAQLARDAELADQNRRSEALNAEINAKNRAVQARNDATRAAFAKATTDYNAALAQHGAQVRGIEADAAKAQAAYQKSMDDWNAAVAACKAGDAAKCQPAKPPTTARTSSP